MTMSDLDELSEMSQEAFTPKPPQRPFHHRSTKPPLVRRPWENKGGHWIFSVLGEIVIDLEPAMRKRKMVVQTGPYKGNLSVPQLMRATGIAERVVFNMVKHPELIHSIRLDVLARVCEALQCQPGDILRYVPRRGGSLRSPQSLMPQRPST
jgi:DNA-binding Xre family transcriptional regulator